MVIAGALVLEPQVLVADEPVSSLDASVRGEILALLLRLRDELGLSVLVVTHDLGLAWNIADRIAVMYLGRIVESGPTEQVLAEPSHPYTQALLSVVPETRHARADRAGRGAAGPDPGARPAAASTRAARRWPPGRPPRPGVDDACRSESLPVLPADREHAAACFLSAGPTGHAY